MKNLTIDIVKSFNEFPKFALPKSGSVDVLLYVLGIKPVFRTTLNRISAQREIQNWCQQHSSYVLFDKFVYVGKSDKNVQNANIVDMSCQAHELQFGQLLGYPECCCRFIASVGEHKIDEMDEKVKSWDFSGEYMAINPVGYFDGLALISHIPCSTTCTESLKIANLCKIFVSKYKEKSKDLKRIYDWINMWDCQ